MVAAEVGITLLPVLAVKPPVSRSPAIQLVPFRDRAPSRRIALVWRRSSALDGFLGKLADIIRSLPAELFEPPTRSKPKRRTAQSATNR
jgi:LysR family hydrogen peroxide-inducible transcriptional activator